MPNKPDTKSHADDFEPDKTNASSSLEKQSALFYLYPNTTKKTNKKGKKNPIHA
jgi:hypothetical protein